MGYMGTCQMRTPYDYQQRGIDYIKMNHKAALYWAMRLGKSFVTIRALKDLPGRKLIICPKAVINTWLDELEMEGLSALWFSSEFLKRVKLHLGNPDWTVVNYEAAMRMPEEMKAKFQHIIIDESAKIKEPKAQITKFLLKSFPMVERKIILSGNPAPNTPLEYFSQMQFLHGVWMGCKNFWQFRQRYFVPDYQGWAWFPRASSRILIKKTLDKTCYFLSRKDVGVENKKVYQKRYVELPPKVMKQYKRMEKEFVATLPDGKELEVKHVLSQLTYLQEMAGGFLKDQEMSQHKIKELVNLLEGELKDEQVLVWCRFRWEIDAIMKAVKNVDCIHGDVSLTNRKLRQDAFNKKEIQVLVLQTSSAKYGLNLSVSDTNIYYSNTFVADDRSQSEMRAEHNTKTTTILCIDLITRDTVDEQILKALQKKKKESQFFMGIVQDLKEKYVV